MQAQPQENPYRYMCEARAAGKPSHEVPAITDVAARCVCDANGWELIRVYEPGKDSDRPATQAAKGDHILSSKQMTALVIEANKSWKHLSKLGVITEKFDTWRHTQVYNCVKREGLSKCQGSQYVKLYDHFRAFRGLAPKGKATKSWSKEGGDTQERREQVIRSLATELGQHARRVDKPASATEQTMADNAIAKGGAITIAYLVHLAKAKNPGQTIKDEDDLIKLPASRLEHLLSTLRNRIAAREGRGNTENRNKGQ